MIMSTKKQVQFYFFASILFLFCSFVPAQSKTSTLSNTQSQLKKLDVQINNLQKNLSKAHNKQALLNQELSKTENQIGKGVKALSRIEDSIQSTEDKIKHLLNEGTRLNDSFKKQQTLLASHVRARYQMGEYQPLKCILSQDSPEKVSRILTYYQYIVQSRQKLIREIDGTRKKINDNQTILHQELVKSVLLKNNLTHHQQKLVENKRYHTTLMHSLNNEIQAQQQNLQEAKKNKANLASLLKSLNAQSNSRTYRPLGQMRKKLPYPVQTAHKSLQRMNQGVTFFADEGTAVLAVYPGKVVFSDWLRGYGLLLIIDHGQGFMTLYAHNKALFKQKGQNVYQNERIASIGHTGTLKQNGLYFEIRVKGKAVPPLGWIV